MSDRMHSDADTRRAEMRERWDAAAPGWARRRRDLQEMGMPVSVRMIELLAPQPGQQLLELAAGPGDTGFLAAELVQPGGTLICSDASEAMLAIARRRAEELGLHDVEFRQLELEWIDLPTASVDGVLCRWGLMLALDPAAAAREIRRVLRPGGRAAVAVWDAAEHNPWGTVPVRALIELGYADPPEPGGPGPFALSGEGQLERLLADAGFVEISVERLTLARRNHSFEDMLAETLDISPTFATMYRALSDDQRANVNERLKALTRPFADESGAVTLPGRSLVAGAEA